MSFKENWTGIIKDSKVIRIHSPIWSIQQHINSVKKTKKATLSTNITPKEKIPVHLFTRPALKRYSTKENVPYPK